MCGVVVEWESEKREREREKGKERERERERERKRERKRERERERGTEGGRLGKEMKGERKETTASMPFWFETPCRFYGAY